jgi:hypothetical protein
MEAVVLREKARNCVASISGGEPGLRVTGEL